jgi:hypothetical protein
MTHFDRPKIADSNRPDAHRYNTVKAGPFYLAVRNASSFDVCGNAAILGTIALVLKWRSDSGATMPPQRLGKITFSRERL